MKIIMIVLLCIIWYLIIGAFVSAGLLKWTGEDLNDEDATLRVAVMVLWPAALIYMLITGLGHVLSKLPTGAYNLLNKPKKKVENDIIYEEYKPSYKTINEMINKLVKKDLTVNESLKIMYAIDEAVERCEQRYGMEIVGIENILKGEEGRIYVDFIMDNGGVYTYYIDIGQRRR